jgi:undecaprenyl-diphosphatase
VTPIGNTTWLNIYTNALYNNTFANPTFTTMIRRVSNGVKKFWAMFTLLSLELLVILVVFFVALLAFVLVARMVFLDKDGKFDERAFRFFSKNVSDVNTSVMQFFSFLGTHYFLIPANLLFIFYFLFIQKRRWYSIKIPSIAIGSLLLMFFLKQIFGRKRPLMPLLESARGLSFPSGHAMMSVSFYGLLIWLVYNNIKNPLLKWCLIIVLALLILFIGLSRVYLRVHYASDVVAGFCLGLMWLILSLSILNRVEKVSRKKISDLVDADLTESKSIEA